MPAALLDLGDMSSCELARRNRAEWLALVAIVALGIGLSIYAVVSERSYVLANERGRLEAQAKTVEENLRHQLAGVRSALVSVRDVYRTQGPRGSGLSIKALRSAMPGVRALIVLDSAGRIIQSSDELDDRHLDDRDFLHSIATMQDPEAVFVSRPYENTQGVSNIKLSMRLDSPPGDVAGVVTAILNPAYFDVVMRSVIYAPDMWSSITQRAGFVVLFVPAANSAYTPSVDMLPLPDSGRMVFQRVINSPQTRLDKDLVVTVSRSYEAINGPWQRLAAGLGLVWAGIMILASFSLALVQAKRSALATLLAVREKELAENAERMELALAGARMGLWDQSFPSEHVKVDERAAQMVGQPMSAYKAGRNWRDEVHPDDLDKVVVAFERHLAAESQFYESEHRLRHRDGYWIWIQARGRIVERSPDGSPLRMLGTRADISESKRHEAEIQRLAFYDGLTGLPNRRLFVDRITRAVNLCQRNRESGAVLFLDLDNFKDLNDTLGHDKGDQLLTHVAARLTEATRMTDTVARLGGDEFVVLLQGLSSSVQVASEQAEQIGRTIVEKLATSYILNGHEVFSTTSVGIAVFDAQIGDIETVMKRADLAMYQAKAAGRNTLCLFTPEMQTIAEQSVELERDLRGALARDELYLNYQPIVDANRMITGVEALVRWRHPRRGQISPADFIPLAEKSGLILQIGTWVLERACSQLYQWGGNAASRHLTVSVNISARQMRQAEFVAQVRSVLTRTGANPHLLRLELTESMFFSDVDEIIGKMTALSSIGVRFSLDDFGIGYSSLSYLKRLPLHQLKIDQSFIREALSHASDAAIVTAIVGLAHSLNLMVVAEGVETQAQHNFLTGSNCDGFQGYLYATPCSAEQITESLVERDQLCANGSAYG
ncbi:EAL domain-containing protein [Comamonas sp. w2-DMI]|uniref:bifunctional diguanylate cyclase/phosphodiesterase n=1 Tax=Comamonas sp. w2-DMI TaxID=3126391 RepID=UPI0032E51D79